MKSITNSILKLVAKCQILQPLKRYEENRFIQKTFADPDCGKTCQDATVFLLMIMEEFGIVKGVRGIDDYPIAVLVILVVKSHRSFLDGENLRPRLSTICLDVINIISDLIVSRKYGFGLRHERGVEFEKCLMFPGTLKGTICVQDPCNEAVNLTSTCARPGRLFRAFSDVLYAYIHNDGIDELFTNVYRLIEETKVLKRKTRELDFPFKESEVTPRRRRKHV